MRPMSLLVTIKGSSPDGIRSGMMQILGASTVMAQAALLDRGSFVRQHLVNRYRLLARRLLIPLGSTSPVAVAHAAGSEPTTKTRCGTFRFRLLGMKSASGVP